MAGVIAKTNAGVNAAQLAAMNKRRRHVHRGGQCSSAAVSHIANGATKVVT
jgi:hypothetical protein